MLKFVISIAACSSFLSVCRCGVISESMFFYDFIRSVDPENVLGIDHQHGNLQNPCLFKINGVKCNLQPIFIKEIRLQNLNLSGKFDTDNLCELPQLKVLSLAKNRIEGMIPESISKCKSLEELDLSYNSLKGSIPSSAISGLKSLKKFNISGNNLVGVVTMASNEITQNSLSFENSQSENIDSGNKKKHGNWIIYVLVAFIVMAFLLVSIFLILKKKKRTEDEEIIKVTVHSPVEIEEDVNQEKGFSELVFFVEDEEQFELEHLLEATTHLRRQGLCSSLYKVKLKHNAIFAVKRLKKLQVSFQQFGETMRKIGSLKHENILPLVAYYSTNNEKLLIYKYQDNGSLLTLFEAYLAGKIIFPWNLRLSIAIGIARSLAFINQNGNSSIPHGNIKPSNILLNKDMQPVLSEYGHTRFLDPQSQLCYNVGNGYTSPENDLSEKSDVFSFGIICLELLTGKIVENSGVDLPKWVRAMVREEWTGEVFDKEISEFAKFAFSLLNVSLKCVANVPQERPSFEEVLVKMEEIVYAQEEEEASPLSLSYSF
ncbi:hypothetical protein Leryth_013757 [Lithospermum erythrorhizon]|nr:hypothetical protein Leryth_013757 [Lithospermum erythrorhizon]